MKQRSVPPTRANLLYSSQPLWSTLFALLFLREPLDGRTGLGSAVLMAAVFAGTLAQRERR